MSPCYQELNKISDQSCSHFTDELFSDNGTQLSCIYIKTPKDQTSYISKMMPPKCILFIQAFDFNIICKKGIAHPPH